MVTYERSVVPVRTGWSPGATVGWAIGILVMYAAIQIPILEFLKAKMVELSSGDRWAIASLATTVLLVPFIFFLVRRRPWSSLAEDLPFRAPDLKQAVLWLGVGILWLVSYYFLSQWGAFAPPRRTIEPFTLTVFGIIVLLFGAPLFTEVLYRGFAFRGLRRTGIALAVILPSVIWTGTHTNLDTVELAWVFVFGLILGTARWKTGSLWTPLAIRFLSNLSWLLASGLASG